MKSEKQLARRVALPASAVASMLFVAGCMSSPTYGTDKTSGEQLLSDVSNITKLSPERKERIAYTPRPDLVRPENARNTPLPAPQDAMASASNPDWVESPEERRRRIRGEQDEANSENALRGRNRGAIASDEVAQLEVEGASSYDDGKVGQSQRHRPGTDPVGQEARRAEIQQRIKENNQGSPTSRKYLSEPPVTYRQPAETAAVGDLGEDEWKKERRLKAEARKKAGKTSWRDYVPGF